MESQCSVGVLPLVVHHEHAGKCNVRPGRPDRGSGSCSMDRWRWSDLVLDCGKETETIKHVTLLVLYLNKHGEKMFILSINVILISWYESIHHLWARIIVFFFWLWRRTAKEYHFVNCYKLLLPVYHHIHMTNDLFLKYNYLQKVQISHHKKCNTKSNSTS